MEWEVTNQHYVSDFVSALKLIDQRLKEHKERNKQATLVVLQSNQSAESLQVTGVPSLLSDFPVLKLKPDVGESEFPALEWIKFACKRSVGTLPQAINLV